MRFLLHHDLEQRRGEGLSSVPKIQPLVILFAGQPARHQLEEFGPVQRQKLHASTLPSVDEEVASPRQSAS